MGDVGQTTPPSQPGRPAGRDARGLGEAVGARVWDELLTVVAELEDRSPPAPEARQIVDATVAALVRLASDSGAEGEGWARAS